MIEKHRELRYVEEKMRREIAKSLPIPMAFLLIAVGTLIYWDARGFNTLTNGRYATPWYSSSWTLQPYTNLRLAFLPKRQYWTMNAIGTERWHVREVAVGQVTFWTITERIPTKSPDARS